MKFAVFAFGQLSAHQLHDIYKLRSAVFVVEQNCAYQDVDDKDLEAHHVVCYQDGDLIAYSRLLPPGISYPEPSIGRVVVRSDHRRRGLGEELMRFSLDACKQLFRAEQVVISAQCYLESFYENLGFVAEGEPYPEDDIPHRRMRLRFR